MPSFESVKGTFFIRGSRIVFHRSDESCYRAEMIMFGKSITVDARMIRFYFFLQYKYIQCYKVLKLYNLQNYAIFSEKLYIDKFVFRKAAIFLFNYINNDTATYVYIFWGYFEEFSLGRNPQEINMYQDEKCRAKIGNLGQMF